MFFGFSDNPTVGASICSALCLPPLTVLTEQEEAPLGANVLSDYMETFNKELTAETAPLGKPTVYVKTESDEPKGKTEIRDLENQSFYNSEQGGDDVISYSVQHVEPLDWDKMSVDSCAVEVQRG